MSIPDNVPVLDIDIFSGITYQDEFQAQLYNDDGTPVDPAAYYDLTGKEVVAIFSSIFGTTDFILSSNDSPTAGGSQLQVTDAVNAAFKFKLSATDLAPAKIAKQIGYWRIEVREPNDAVLFVRGTIRVVPFNEEGIL